MDGLDLITTQLGMVLVVMEVEMEVVMVMAEAVEMANQALLEV